MITKDSETVDKFAEELAELLKILANPIRLKILALCLKKERNSRELRKILGISKPLLISHLRKLVNAGFLESRVEVDKDKIIVRKYYKTRDLEICVGKTILGEIAAGIENE